MTSSLKIENVTKSFGAVQVLKGISTYFAAGQVTAIVGDNGAGKSTLLKLIAGIYKSDSGSIFLGDADMTGTAAAAHRRAGIEMVYQDLALAKQHNAATNLFLGREMTSTWCGFLRRKAMMLRAREEMGRLGISIPDMGLPVGLLSGGQQQAVAIARAVLFNPRVLLLDEPTAALAAREVQGVLILIRQQREHGRTVILVSHRLNDVFAVADRIIVMRQGRIATDESVAATSMSRVIETIVN